jgi:MauM/NapG family ferredoxin protein
MEGNELGRISSPKHRRMQLLRIFSQSAFFSLFLYLLLGTHSSGNDSISAVERFFHFDPFLGLVTFIASRAFFAVFLFSLITIAITAIFGRYVCGWVCPLGSLLHFFSYLLGKMERKKPKPENDRSLAWKYFILLFTLVASVFSLDIAGFLDPLSLLYRSFATAVLPAASLGLGAGAGFLQKSGLSNAGGRASLFFQDLVINTTFRQGLLIGLIFLGIILLNRVRPRFWCRYLCPAGALFGLLARWNLVKLKIDENKCNDCRLCSLRCPAQASPYPNERWNRAECFYCYSCASGCPHGAIAYPLSLPSARPFVTDLSRREIIFTSTLGLLTVPLIRVSDSERPSEKLIRPPGALPEPQFLAKCIKCGECIKVCPTNGLQLASGEGGFLGLWTPILIPRIGYCEYYCSLCTQVCPTGAIQELSVKEKLETRIGSAWIKKHRCLPYALGEPCRICEQKCPTSPKAILMVPSEFSAPQGKFSVQVPIVDPDLCIGCGVCETKCPVTDEPAIYCTSYGESRSERILAFPEYDK